MLEKNYKSLKNKLVERIVKIQRVTKVSKGGKKESFRSLSVIGDEKGIVGVGIGKATNRKSAIKKSITNAKKNFINISLTKSYSIHYPIYSYFGAAKLFLKPAPPGSGIVAGGSSRVIFELVGIRNIISKQLGSSSPINNAKATIAGLMNFVKLDIIKIPTRAYLQQALTY